MSVNEACLDTLISLARQRGRISTEDLRQALPIDLMTIEDISTLIIRLQEADIDLEIDQTLLLPARPMATRAATITSKHTQLGLPEAAPDVPQETVSSPALAVGLTAKTRAARSPTDTAPTHALILVVVFVIATLAFVIATLAFVISWAP